MFRFLWVATRGYRFTPWRSPYLRWRMETYSGIPAESFTAGSFFKLLIRERGPMWRYLLWVRSNAHLLRD
ncbi:MAG TPA: hypothetical protein VH351_10760 [Bryobacteraceae bacterium]|jgi:hypothetical protein|nr:hypothetical protein [Bryobacteraceae bacterium]